MTGKSTPPLCPKRTPPHGNANVPPPRWQRAAALDEPDALYNLAVKHDHGRGGLGVDMDHMSAFELYKKAAEAGHSGAYCNMANMYREGRGVPEDLKLAAKCFEHAAQKDVAEAQFNLALMYYHGHGVRERASVAVKWFSRAVEQDFSRAQFMLGFMYEHGEGVAKDEGEAAKLYSKVGRWVGHEGGQCGNVSHISSSSFSFFLYPPPCSLPPTR